MSDGSAHGAGGLCQWQGPWQEYPVLTHKCMQPEAIFLSWSISARFTSPSSLGPFLVPGSLSP
jgi:hypothetical protein